MSDNDKSLREHLLSLLSEGNAHVSFDDFVAHFPADSCGNSIQGLPYTAWQVLEHMRIAQWDILEFCRDAKHASPNWPDGYWPKPREVGNATLWNESVEKFRGDLKEMEELISDSSTDLFAKSPYGDGQTILREALLVADHNAYHLGVLVAIGRMMSKS